MHFFSSVLQSDIYINYYDILQKYFFQDFVYHLP